MGLFCIKKVVLKGSFVIETSFIMALVCWVVFILSVMLFHFHDKNVATGIAMETLSAGSGRTRMEENFSEEDLESYYRSRIAGKLILYSSTEVNVSGNKDFLAIHILMNGKNMRSSIKLYMEIINPEKKMIRNKQLKESISGD